MIVRSFVGALVPLVLMGCTLLPAPADVRQGPCTLEPVTMDGRVLEPPYAVEMQSHPGSPPTADVMWRASGWTGAVPVAVTKPSGQTIDDGGGFDAPTLNAGNNGQTFDERGTWRLRFEDQGGCVAEFNVEVR